MTDHLLRCAAHSVPPLGERLVGCRCQTPGGHRQAVGTAHLHLPQAGLALADLQCADRLSFARFASIQVNLRASAEEELDQSPRPPCSQHVVCLGIGRGSCSSLLYADRGYACQGCSGGGHKVTWWPAARMEPPAPSASTRFECRPMTCNGQSGRVCLLKPHQIGSLSNICTGPGSMRQSTCKGAEVPPRETAAGWARPWAAVQHPAAQPAPRQPAA